MIGEDFIHLPVPPRSTAQEKASAGVTLPDGISERLTVYENSTSRPPMAGSFLFGLWRGRLPGWLVVVDLDEEAINLINDGEPEWPPQQQEGAASFALVLGAPGRRYTGAVQVGTANQHISYTGYKSSTSLWNRLRPSIHQTNPPPVPSASRKPWGQPERWACHDCTFPNSGRKTTLALGLRPGGV